MSQEKEMEKCSQVSPAVSKRGGGNRSIKWWMRIDGINIGGRGG
jgi:hypothetical protein